ncbi:MAG: TonB-dependent receptor domain-containing protein, partial [Acidimicrobiales bacterium]
FNVRQWGLYLQDRWTVTPKLILTAGLRVDVPNMDSPQRNVALDTTLGINTSDFPSGNMLWAPRVGFNYDVKGDGSTFLRGGVGIFSGRPPYVWVSNAFVNTGLEQATLICDGALTSPATDTVPVFTVDPANQPTACRGGAGASTPIPSIVYFESDVKLPQNMKLAFGLDHRLPWDLVGTFDFVYTKWVNQFYITDANLQGVVGTLAGEAGRPLYGALSATGTGSTPARRSASFRDVLQHRTESDDRSFSVTAQLQKRFNSRLWFNAGYTYSHTEDLFSLGSSIAFSNFRFTVLDGTLENRNLRTSVYDIPHSVKLSGTVVGPADMEFTFVYTGNSGHPYTYVVATDANGDGVTQNDAVYVPRDASDIFLQNAADWATLDAFI